MAMTQTSPSTEPTRAEIEALQEPTVLEFGAAWCGYCQAAQPLIARAFTRHPTIGHIGIEDGKGRPLGRSYRVTLWPTLVFLVRGKEVARLVRPNDLEAIERALTMIDIAS